MPSFSSWGLGSTAIGRVLGGRVRKPAIKSPTPRRQQQLTPRSPDSSSPARRFRAAVSESPPDVREQSVVVEEEEEGEGEGDFYEPQLDHGNFYREVEAVYNGVWQGEDDDYGSEPQSGEEACDDVDPVSFIKVEDQELIDDKVRAFLDLARLNPLPSIEGEDPDLFDDEEDPDLFDNEEDPDLFDDEEDSEQPDDDDSSSDDDVPDDFEVIEFEDEWEVNERALRYYRKQLFNTKGAETWPRDHLKVHKLLWLRGQFPLMPSSWALDLVDHPTLNHLFAPIGLDKKTLIENESSRFRATRALRNLFELPFRVKANIQTCAEDRIEDLIKKELTRYSRWAEEDAKRKEYDFVSPVFVFTGNELDGGHDRFDRALERKAWQYRHKYWDLGVDRFPPLIFGLIVFQHVVMTLVKDVRKNSKARAVAVDQFDVSNTDQWLDSALGMALPIHLAKASICAHWEEFPRKEEEEVDDPDL